MDYLAILETAGMQQHGAITVEGVHVSLHKQVALCDVSIRRFCEGTHKQAYTDQIIFSKVLAHLELILHGSPPLDAAREVDGRQQQYGIL